MTDLPPPALPDRKRVMRLYYAGVGVSLVIGALVGFLVTNGLSDADHVNQVDACQEALQIAGDTLQLSAEGYTYMAAAIDAGVQGDLGGVRAQTNRLNDLSDEIDRNRDRLEQPLKECKG